MKQQDFIDAIYDAGWVSRNDAQHDHIKALHKKLFPLVVELEIQIKNLEHENFSLTERVTSLEDSFIEH